jgi:hypothetical protein
MGGCAGLIIVATAGVIIFLLAIILVVAGGATGVVGSLVSVVVVSVVIGEPDKEGLLLQLLHRGHIVLLALHRLVDFIPGEEVVVALLLVLVEEEPETLTISEGGLILGLHFEVPLLYIAVQRWLRDPTLASTPDRSHARSREGGREEEEEEEEEATLRWCVARQGWEEKIDKRLEFLRHD